MSSLLSLLRFIETNGFVEIYTYFPDVALSGGQFLDRADIDRLLQEDYLEPATQDRLGASLQLSSWAKELLHSGAIKLAAA